MLFNRLYPDPIQIDDHAITAQVVLEKLKPLLTSERIFKIEQVANDRIFSVQLVLENIYDRGNISAIIRSCEALGIGAAHVIEFNQNFKNSDRVSKGAEKWVKTTKWKSTTVWATEMKAQGFQIVATHLSPKSIPIDQVDFSKPTAFVLGNEKDGISPDMQALADHQVIIPMSGFVQSFNISVAGAIGLYHITQELKRNPPPMQLTEADRSTLQAYYCLNSLPSGKEYLRELILRKELTVF